MPGANYFFDHICIANAFDVQNHPLCMVDNESMYARYVTTHDFQIVTESVYSICVRNKFIIKYLLSINL